MKSNPIKKLNDKLFDACVCPNANKKKKKKIIIQPKKKK